MEQIITFIHNNLSDIIYYAGIIIAYILTFLARFYVRKTGRSLHTLVKENTSSTGLKIDNSVKELKRAKSIIEEKDKQIEELIKRMDRLEKAILVLAEGE